MLDGDCKVRVNVGVNKKDSVAASHRLITRVEYQNGDQNEPYGSFPSHQIYVEY